MTNSLPFLDDHKLVRTYHPTGENTIIYDYNILVSTITINSMIIMYYYYYYLSSFVGTFSLREFEFSSV